MIPILIAAPAVEPVSTAELRDYLRLDGDDELGLISALIRSARLTVEAASGCILIEQAWRLPLPGVPACGAIRAPLAPLIAVDRVRSFDGAGTPTDLDAGDYRLDPWADPPRILFEQAPAPEGRLEIDLRAGFGATPESVPEPLRQAVRLLVAHWFENRGDAEPRQAPADLGALISPFRRARL